MINVNMLELKDIVKSFNDRTILNKVSFNMKAGNVTGIIGHSGSGKSTLLNCIYGSLTPDSGTILFKGIDMYCIDDVTLSWLRNSEISYIFQGMSLLPNMTVKENILVPFMFSKNNNDNIADKADYLMDTLMIKEISNSYPSEISGGEMKRCAIARTMIMEPKLILADEPTSDLDPYNTNIIMKTLSEYANKGNSVLLVTHDMNNLQFCNEVYEMKDGELIHESTINDF